MIAVMASKVSGVTSDDLDGPLGAETQVLTITPAGTLLPLRC
jgi:hypothetical protein